MELRWERATSLFQFLRWTEPTQRSEIISFLLNYYLFKTFHRFLLSPVRRLNPHNRHTVTMYLEDVGSTQSIACSSSICIIVHISTQPHSLIVKCVNYLWLNKVLNRRGKLWTCFRHVKTDSPKINHIDHERTITLFTIYALLLSIRSKRSSKNG